MAQLYTDSFGDRLGWIHRNSQGLGLEKLDRFHRNELLKAIYNARQTGNPGFSEFELEVLELAVSYCCYFQNRQPVPFSKFDKLRKPEHYYAEAKKLMTSGQKISFKAVRLSSLVRDNQLSEFLLKTE